MGRIVNTKAANEVRADVREVLVNALEAAGFAPVVIKEGYAITHKDYVVVLNATVKAEDFDLDAAMADKEATETRKAEKAEAAALKKAAKAEKATK